MTNGVVVHFENDEALKGASLRKAAPAEAPAEAPAAVPSEAPVAAPAAAPAKAQLQLRSPTVNHLRHQH